MKYLTKVIVCAVAIIGAAVCSANLTSTNAVVASVSDAEGVGVIGGGGDPCGSKFTPGVVACGLGCVDEGSAQSCGTRPTSYASGAGGGKTNASEITTCAVCGVTCSTGTNPILISCTN